MHTFVHNKSITQLLNISPKSFIFLKTFNSEFSYIEVCFTDQNSKPLEKKDDKINTTLIINWCLTYVYLTRYSIEPRDRIFVKGYRFLSSAENIVKNIGKNLSGNYSPRMLATGQNPPHHT